MKWMLYGDDTDYKIQLPGQENNYDYKQLNVYAKSGHVFPSGLRLPSSTDQEEKLLDHIILFLQSDSDTLRFSAAKFLFDLFQVCVCLSVCMCVCVCVCVLAFVHWCVCLLCFSVHMSLSASGCVCLYMCLCLSVCLCMCLPTLYICFFMSMYACVEMFVCGVMCDQYI